jgi:RNA polymerase sigma-70 factor (ECF subfamily)
MSDDRRALTTAPGDPPDLSDEALLARLIAGRLDALDTFYERYRTMAYGIARRITTDDALAEDVVQEAFLGVWRGAAGYVAGRGSIRTWLLSIVHHRAIDAVRRRRAVSDLPDETDGAQTPEPLVAPDIWNEVSAHLDGAAVSEALATLPEAQRSALELAYFGGLSQTEIATRTGAPLGTVKSRIRLGLLGLRHELERRGMP